MILEKYKDEKHIQNYTNNRFNVDNLLGLFLVFDKRGQKIVGFMSVFRPKVWPQNVARISNRTWIDPDYRLKGLSLVSEGRNLRLGINYGMTLAYDFQINCCKKHKISLAVVTRENMKGPDIKNNTEFLYRRLKLAKPEWNLAANYYLTCSNKNDYRCWQRLLYLELKTGVADLILRKMTNITPEEYLRKFSTAVV